VTHATSVPRASGFVLVGMCLPINNDNNPSHQQTQVGWRTFAGEAP